MRWTRGELSDTELDVELLMWDIRRRIRTQFLPSDGCIIKMYFTDLPENASWWLIFDGGELTLSSSDPGSEPYLVIQCGLRAMIALWMGDLSLQATLARRQLTLRGQPVLIRTIERWLPLARYAIIRPATEATAPPTGVRARRS
jgi:hypothetical protein